MPQSMTTKPAFKPLVVCPFSSMSALQQLTPVATLAIMLRHVDAFDGLCFQAHSPDSLITYIRRRFF